MRISVPCRCGRWWRWVQWAGERCRRPPPRSADLDTTCNSHTCPAGRQTPTNVPVRAAETGDWTDGLPGHWTQHHNRRAHLYELLRQVIEQLVYLGTRHNRRAHVYELLKQWRNVDSSTSALNTTSKYVHALCSYLFIHLHIYLFIYFTTRLHIS